MWEKVSDKKYWDKLVTSRPHSRFLQSWEWGEFQQVLGRPILRFSDNGMFAQAIKMSLPGGFEYWYLPHGHFDSASFSELQKIFGNNKELFFRVDPVAVIDTPIKVKEISSIQPRCTLILDLSKSTAEIFSNMHIKTRYNTNLARKKGVKITSGSVDDFIELNHATTERDRFTSHPDGYYRKMSKILLSNVCQLKIWQATFEGQVIASAIIIYFGDTVTYVHGASGNEFRNVKAPHLLHWEIIKDAQRQGFRYYDWWGANPQDGGHSGYKKSWEGVTRFKQGFGGEVVCSPPSFDLIYRPGWYRLYRLLSRVKRVIGY